MAHVVSLLFHDVCVRELSESGFCSQAANRYKLTTDEFDAQLAGVSATVDAAPILPGDLPVSGKATRTAFSITVDDGGVSYYTAIADRLEARGWRGACFVATGFIGCPGFLNSQQIRELDQRGHLIGSHSSSHPTRFSACTPEQMRHEWRQSRELLEDLLGHPVTVASLPGGYFSNDVARAAAASGVELLLTSEPETRIRHVDGCQVAGRFTIRAGSRPGLARAFVSPAPFRRTAEWVSWNAKGLVKPLLGASYPVVADLLLARKAFDR